MYKKLFLTFSGFLVFSWCFAFTYRNGDLIFQTKGNTSFSEAISESTSQYSDSLDFVHVGIAMVTPEGETEVIEASPKGGVRIVHLEEFVNAAPEVNGKPGVLVKRICKEFPEEKAIEKAITFLGEPYDWSFLPDNGKMYCSELVYESFMDNDGNHIFKRIPMNFRNTDGTMPRFWVNLFEELGEDIPEGIPGTNPNNMADDPILQEVFRYF